MEKLIEALNIFLEYGNPDYPFYCDHEELQVHGYNIYDMSEHDIDTLAKLGFYWDKERELFYSFKYGDC